ncbi:hypothetical protein DQ384_28175 [Sphaerisporangium album]|uniref:Uncharacterized protein n=1 Tax=Sphaerisporangium album TaxID=509200 RepID=A0A367F8T9_9ACTN|nr:DUF6400 family protein [Sphaerisporangium album]RCG26778.1 hypothetical protein DQ384_28175 [Sphaerisporangium album]
MSHGSGHNPPEHAAPEHVVFEMDLTLHESRRRAEVISALGPGWDPLAVMRAEEEACDLLYSGLDARQRETYDMLVAAGVLPRREADRASD